MLNDVQALLTNGGSTHTVDQLLSMSVKDFARTNANEIMTTTQTGFGKDFVPSELLYSSLLDRVNDGDSLLGDFLMKQMQGPVEKVPSKGAVVNMKLISENNTNPTGGLQSASQLHKPGTALITLTAKEISGVVYYPDTLLEDSVIGMAEYVMDYLFTSYSNTFHNVLINGDTATGASVNINIIDGNTSALDGGNDNSVILADGFRKTAIDRNATVDALGNFDVSVILSALAKGGAKFDKKQDLLMIMDRDTYYDTLGFDPVLTMDKFGSSATIVNGVVTALFGITIKVRSELTKATATGEISATPANNTKGQCVIVHKKSVHVGIRRDLTTEVSRYAESRTTAVTGSARIALTIDNIQNAVAPTEAVVLIHNI